MKRFIVLNISLLVLLCAWGQADAVSGATVKQGGEVSNFTNMANDSTERKRLERAQETPSAHGFWIGGYGEVSAKRCFYSNNYLRYYSPEKYKGDQYGEFDLPHVVISLGYDFEHGWSMGTEIEFEHGGIEAATEIEEEEGGEYESEIERGGEVALEQFWLQKKFADWAILRAGMQVIPVGGLNAHHEPTEFFGVYRPEGEFTILPSTWHEVGLTFMGNYEISRKDAKTQSFTKYQLMLLPGLDSDRFNRKGWVNPGAGSPYEFKLANAYAVAARAEWQLKMKNEKLKMDSPHSLSDFRLGISAYIGNSFRNTLSRSQKELIESEKYKDIRGTVYIGSMDFCYKGYGLILRGGATYGHLDDAKLITQYNMQMRKDSPSAKQWVASDALAAGVEVGYDLLDGVKRSKKELKGVKGQMCSLYLFARYDYYDSMFRFDGKRDYTYAWCGRHKLSAGLNYYPLPQIAIKAEFSYAILNKGMTATGELSKIYNDEPAVALGICYAGFFKFK